MRKLAGWLTYSNVMATIAVFVALGAGAYAAVNLPRNAVKSKHIKNSQVKNKDLRDEAVNAAKLRGDVRPLHFDGSLPIGSLNDVILEEEGYRVSFACENDGDGEPRIDGTIRVPENGTVDILQTQVLNTTQSSAGQLLVSSADGLDIGVASPDANETNTLGAVATYSGASRAALISLHGVADDDTDSCSLNGSLVPLTQVE